MSIARDFDDFKEEIELAFAQNACVEIELYSIIASVIRESKNKQKLSIRDVSSRKRISVLFPWILFFRNGSFKS